jgi:L-ascorbate metabolism protein UlaG (beta-lactamase superfamily)
VVELTWLGQAGFLLSANGEAVLVDPFLSPHKLRTYPPPGLEVLGRDVSWLLATHEHEDHLDLRSLPVLLERFPRLHVVLPSPLAPRVASLLASDRIHPVQPGDLVAGREVSIRPVPACHGVTIKDGYSTGRRAPSDPTPFVGYLLEFPGLTIYHAGDTIVNQEVLDALQNRPIDVALLPVNGRDYFREAAGIVGNLSVEEAVQLAAQLRVRVLIPMHHDLVYGNTERAGAVADFADQLGVPIHVVNLARFTSLRLPAFH